MITSKRKLCIAGIAGALLVVSGQTTDAADLAVYRPQLNGVENEAVSWRRGVRRSVRSFERTSRRIERDVRDFQRDVQRDLRRAPRVRSYGYHPSYYAPRGFAPRGGIRLGSAVIYW